MWDSQFPANYHHWPGSWSYYLFGWEPQIWAKPTVEAREYFQGGRTKYPTKQWWKKTKDGGWALAPFCHLFCSREQFFLRDKPTPTTLPPNFGPPPAPGSATGNTARQSLLPFQLTYCTGSPPWDNTRRGSNYPASEIQLSTSLWRVNTSSALMTKFKEFSTECANKIYWNWTGGCTPDSEESEFNHQI